MTLLIANLRHPASKRELRGTDGGAKKLASLGPSRILGRLRIAIHSQAQIETRKQIATKIPGIVSHVTMLPITLSNQLKNIM